MTLVRFQCWTRLSIVWHWFTSLNTSFLPVLRRNYWGQVCGSSCLTGILIFVEIPKWHRIPSPGPFSYLSSSISLNCWPLSHLPSVTSTTWFAPCQNMILARVSLLPVLGKPGFRSVGKVKVSKALQRWHVNNPVSAAVSVCVCVWTERALWMSIFSTLFCT